MQSYSRNANVSKRPTNLNAWYFYSFLQTKIIKVVWIILIFIQICHLSRDDNIIKPVLLQKERLKLLKLN